MKNFVFYECVLGSECAWHIDISEGLINLLLLELEKVIKSSVLGRLWRGSIVAFQVLKRGL